MKFYLINRLFRIKQEDSYFELKEIKARVQEGSVLYLIYTNDIVDLDEDILGTFVDDQALPSIGKDHEEAADFRE